MEMEEADALAADLKKLNVDFQSLYQQLKNVQLVDIPAELRELIAREEEKRIYTWIEEDLEEGEQLCTQ
jgi:predicted KAP-like P-loop ATPase